MNSIETVPETAPAALQEPVSEAVMSAWSEVLKGGKPVIGRSYIGAKAVYRVVTSEWDRAPLCFHRHESEKEALECPDALAAATK